MQNILSVGCLEEKSSSILCDTNVHHSGAVQWRLKKFGQKFEAGAKLHGLTSDI